ncbi:MAG: response regulator [Bryobacterales bacterium]|nr:response regulator [Bryobacterales bacterium]MBV9396770.1 response regulator [Bryobacterales bacterium]
MSVILLADDSAHAQRMGERILREEGYEVVSLTDGVTTVMRLADVDPDLVIADVFLPGRNGVDLCRYIKAHHRHARVVLTAGLLEKFNEEDARQAGCDAILRKPFEASVVMQTIRPLLDDAQSARGTIAEGVPAAAPAPISDGPPRPPGPLPDPRRIEAAVTLALDAALPALVREITEKVLIALGH